MAHPTFTDRSFSQMARRALSRASFDADRNLREAILTRARLADAKASLGAHPQNSRSADRRRSIYDFAIRSGAKRQDAIRLAIARAGH